MQPFQNVPHQVGYWDRMAGLKRFFHPLRLDWLTRHVTPRACILDFGCGYGRTLAELLNADYKNVLGVDSSLGMLKRCHFQLPDVSLIQNCGETIPLATCSLDVVLLFTVLTCIPNGEDQRVLLAEITRALRPGGFLYISDLLLNCDLRNLERYERYAEEFRCYGVFEHPEGPVFRHHRKEWIAELTGSFIQVEYASFEATTMNGNRSAAFQYLGRLS